MTADAWPYLAAGVVLGALVTLLALWAVSCFVPGDEVQTLVHNLEPGGEPRPR